MLVRTLLILVLSLSVASLAARSQGQEAEKAPTSPSRSSKAKSRPPAESAKSKSSASAANVTSAEATAEFDTVYKDFKELINRLTYIQQKYGGDSNADKKALEQEFESKVEQAKALEMKLAAAAERAYLAAPNKARDQNEYLMARLSKLVATDDFEDAARLSRLLIENQFDQKYFNLVAGIAFFGTNDFDDAEKYLKLAEKQGDFGAQIPAAQIGRRDLELINKHGYKELWAKERAIRAAEEKAGDLPKVKIETSKGDIIVELFENEAPIATNNFVNLVEKKFYEGVKFHRVLPGFMAQGGDPKGDGSGGPGYTIPDEYIQDNHRNHFRGSLSMARTGQRDSGGSQFFICFQPIDHLDGQYTVFGRVVDGFDVLAKLQRCQYGDTNTPDKIVRATVISKRNHKYEPKVKLPEKK